MIRALTVLELLAFIGVGLLAKPAMRLLALAPAGSRRLQLAWWIADRMSAWGHSLDDAPEAHP